MRFLIGFIQKKLPRFVIGGHNFNIKYGDDIVSMAYSGGKLKELINKLVKESKKKEL